MRQEMPENREVIIVYDDKNEKLARLLLAHLRGSVQGIVFSRRNARYNCNPDCYLNVIRIDRAKLDKDSNNVLNVGTQPYSEAKKRSRYSNLSWKKHIEMQAASLADQIASRF